MKPVYLYITPFFPGPDTWRGAYSLDFVRALARLSNYDVRVVIPGRGPDYAIDGIPVIRLREWRLPSMMFPLLFARRNARALLRALRDRGIAPARIAVCHANTPPYAPYALVVRRANPAARALLQHHFLDSYGLALGRILRRSFLHRLLHYFLFRRIHAQLDGHIFISEANRRAFLAVPDATWTDWPDYRRQMRGLSWCPSPAIRAAYILRNGVDTARFNPAGRTPHTGLVLGCVANFTPQKDHLTLLRALDLARNDLGDWHLRLIGTGPTLRDCQTFVREHALQDRVTFEPERPHSELPAFYRALDLLVLPGRFEAFGCVCPEAHACGTPFITCSNAGAAELIPPADRDRWLVPPHDPAALAAALRRFAHTRPPQTLTLPLSFDTLLPPFLSWLHSLPKATP